MLTDSHCHLASHRFPADEVAAVVQRARDAGVTRLVTLATRLGDLEDHLRLAEAHDGVRACLGIHPTDVHAEPDDAVERIRPLLSRPGVAAIGETGLDYFHPAPDGWDEEPYRERQRNFLDQHFQLARDLDFGVVIHTRDRQGNDSFRDALGIYRRYASEVRAVFHCFIGSMEDAMAVIELGGLVSFGGVATFKNASAVLEVASGVPLASMMLETDSPYLAPHPHRGTRNEPAMVRVIAERIASSRGIPLDELAEATSRVAAEFFRW
jgi:TatD DNase family protein